MFTGLWDKWMTYVVIMYNLRWIKRDKKNKIWLKNKNDKLHIYEDFYSIT